MKVKVLSSRTEIGLEHAVNEFLAERRHEIIDIKFSMSLGPYGHIERFNSDAEYSTMIVYDEST